MNGINFNKEQEQILFGSLLGDGCIYKNIQNGKIFFYYTESHSLKQKDYLLWKNGYLNFNIFNHKQRLAIYIYKTNKIFKDYGEIFYPNGKKIVTREILDKLEPLALAVWFMDDGSYNYRDSKINIHTQCFGLEGNQIIRQYFKEKWNIDCRIAKTKKSFANLNYILLLNKKNSYIFLKLVKHHILQIPSMHYKLGLNEKMRINAKIKYHQWKQKYIFKNKRFILDKAKNYYMKHREKILEKKKIYSKKPEIQERRRIYERAYCRDNKGKIRMKLKRWYNKKKLRVKL